MGIDAVPIERMRRALRRTPRLAQRVFTEHELSVASERASPVASLAARFAAKEATRKALGKTLPWKGVEVWTGGGRAPSLRVADQSGLNFHVSLSHTDDVAVAVVVAER